MKLEPKYAAGNNPLKSLSPLERNCYYLAVAVAFVSVFVWFFKILFF